MYNWKNFVTVIPKHSKDLEWWLSVTINPYIAFYISTAIILYASWYVLRRAPHPQLKFEASIMLVGAWFLSQFFILTGRVFPIIVCLGTAFISFLACKIAAKNPRE